MEIIPSEEEWKFALLEIWLTSERRLYLEQKNAGNDEGANYHRRKIGLHLAILGEVPNRIHLKPQFDDFKVAVGYPFVYEPVEHLTFNQAYERFRDDPSHPAETATFLRQACKAAIKKLNQGYKNYQSPWPPVAPPEVVSPNSEAAERDKAAAAKMAEDAGARAKAAAEAAETVVESLEFSTTLEFYQDGTTTLGVLKEKTLDSTCDKLSSAVLKWESIPMLCLENAQKMRINSNFLVDTVAIKTHDTLLVGSRPYSRTLEEVMSLLGKDHFWTDCKLYAHFVDWSTSVAYASSYRPTVFFQNLIRQLVVGLFSVNESEICYQMSIDSIVFLEGDAKYESPKFLSTFFTDTCDLEGLFKGLLDVLHKCINRLGVPMKFVVKDMLRFMSSLNCPSLELTDHPALWASPKKLEYILTWYIKHTYNEVTIEGRPEYFETTIPNWKKEAKKHPLLKESVDNYGDGVIQMLKFIRDSYLHLREPMMYVMGRTYISPIKWTRKDIDDLCEFLFPLLGCTLKEFTLDVVESRETVKAVLRLGAGENFPGENPEAQLYVSELPDYINDLALFDFFKKFGTVETVKVAYDLKLNCKGSGYVQMASGEQAKEAIKGFHESEVKDELGWKVEKAKPRKGRNN